MTYQKMAMQVETLLPGGGKMGDAVRAFDWSTTPLGDITSWSVSLRTAVNICLNSRFPMVIWWGDELTLLYNDAWRPILGSKHPHALGQPGQAVWAEIWEVIGVQLNSVLATGKATWSDDLLLMVDRHGYPEEAYFTYSYSPIFTETGDVGGAFTAVTETTRRVLGERRVATLRDLAAQAGVAKTVEQAFANAIETLAKNPIDLPFALLYQLEDGSRAHLQGITSSVVDQLICPECVELNQASDGWSLVSVIRTGEAILIDDIAEQFKTLPAGPLKLPSRQALVLPIRASGQDALVGLLVAGVNPCRELDDDYRNFFDMVAGHIATSIANARAYEEERKRVEALAELDRAKTTFFSNVSHEFRTPLTLMLGPLEDLLTDQNVPLPPPHHERVEILQRNSLRLLKLVNTLLDFSRIEAGRIQASYEPTDLSIYTSELASVFRSAIERAGLQLTVECPPLPAPVYVDRDMWEKIVLNLLSNAFKFTFEGEIRVSLRWRVGQEEEGRRQEPNEPLLSASTVLLEVQDTGTGIPATELPRLFDRFHRVQGTRARTHEGSGIGLAFVQELVHLHGGNITVESLEGHGSTFTVMIPTGTAHLPADRIQTTPTLVSTAVSADAYVMEALRWLPENGNGESETVHRDYSSLPPRAPHSTLSSARILLVDDNTDMRNYVARLLSNRYEVEAVTDGIAALEAIARRLPDLVLTDVMMPRLDGFGLLNALRRDEKTRELPIILLSARAGEEAQAEGLMAGADDYLIKPFSARELLARVESNLKMTQLRQRATDYQTQLRLEAEAARTQINTILESITDAFIAFDRDWRYTYVNREAARLLGRSPDELLGRRWQDVFPDIAQQKTVIAQQFERAMAEQITIRFEAFSYSTNRWLDISLFPSDAGLTVYFRDISDRRQIEDERRQADIELRQREQQFRTVVENTPDLIIRYDRQLRHLYANPSLKRALGIPPDQFIGKTAVEMGFTDATSQAWQTVLQQVFTTGNGESFEFEFPSPSGEQRSYQARFVPESIENGTVKTVLAVVRDVTAYKRVELALRDSEARYRTLANAVPQLMWVNAPDGTVQFLNQRWSEYTGVPLEGNLKFWQQVIHPEDAQTALEAEDRAIQAGEAYEMEVRLKRVDQVYRWHLARVVPLKDDRGHVLSWFGTATDIDDRKQAEESLQQYNLRLTLALDAAKMGSWDWNPHTDEIVWTSYHEMIFGYEPGTPNRTYQDWVNRIHPDDLPRVLATLQTAMDSKQDYKDEYRIIWDDGSLHWVSAFGRFQYDAKGQPIRMVGMLFDITDRKQAEHEREQLLERERTARSEAEAANRIKDEFLAVLSHELRSPLNPILGWAKLLQTRKLDEMTTRQALATIERNAKLQTQLIEDLLDVSRILRGKMALNVTPVDLVTTIEAALETVCLSAEAKGIQIHKVLNPIAGHVTGDAARLQQVAWNLLSNAIKFTSSGGHVDVRLEQVGSYAQIQVKDTGKGINPAFLPYVFDYFRQEDGTTTRRFGGLGLGLAIVRHLTELHGGTVAADSPGEGQGATFTVRLPLMQIEGKKPTEESPASRLTPHISPLKGLQVLAVDDDADVRDLLRFILEQAGAEATILASATEALNWLETHAADVLISDIGMPNVDGYMLMRQVRSLAPNRSGQIPAIALTAYAGELDQKQAIAAGFQYHISKPVEPEVLVRAIATLITRST